MLYARFGIQPQVDYVTTTATGEIDFERVCAFVVHLSHKAPPHVSAAAIDFATCLTSNATPTTPLRDACDFCIYQVSYPRAQVDIKLLHTDGNNGYKSEQSTTSTPAYLVSSKVRDAKWKLLLDDAVTTCQILRLGLGPTLLDVAEYLLERGISFKTVHQYMEHIDHLPLPRDPPLFREGVPLGLSIRTQDCEYTKHDYAMYEQERDRILQSPRGRAALMMGGIV